MYGELVPLGGGDPIPLLKSSLLVGRRESCDIVLRFPNVSAHHCQLTINSGYWFIRDLNSKNGIKVNNVRVGDKRVDPGDTVAIAKHRYELRYSPIELGAVGPPPNEDSIQEVLRKSLLERAGLVKDAELAKEHAPRKDRQPPTGFSPRQRYDVMNNDAGQIRDSNRPV